MEMKMEIQYHNATDVQTDRNGKPISRQLAPACTDKESVAVVSMQLQSWANTSHSAICTVLHAGIHRT